MPLATLHRLWPLSLCLGVLLHAAASQARPCDPSDPDGTNPGNLCPVYPPYGLTIHSDSFQTGSASKGYYGPRISPTEPGKPLNPREGRDGYWTTIQAGDGRSQIRTSKGKQWNLSVP